jgi:hypothetical protein
MKVWHDDIRPAPEGWTWARTNTDAIRLLVENEVSEISLDHDLGLHHFTEDEIEADPDLLFGRGQAEETGYDLVNGMCENGYVPPKVTIHSWNPDGARAMAARLNYFGHDCTISPYVVKR